MVRRVFWGLLYLVFCCGMASAQTETSADVIVYGGTPAGVMAAVAAGKAGQKVILLEPHYYVGGMLAGGLTKTDIGRKDTVGGLSMEFFQRVLKYYENTYGKNSEQAKDCHGGVFFEAHVAAAIFEKMMAEAGVTVVKKEVFQRAQVKNHRIVSLTVRQYETGVETTFSGKMFVDGSYEGDLMAGAGVIYRVGREGKAEYGESLAGLNAGPPELLGTGDHRVQSYNLRSTLTTRDDIRVPIPKPEHYTPEIYENMIAGIAKRKPHTFEEVFHDAPEWGPINGKSDPNKADSIGLNLGYPEGSEAERKAIYNEIRDRWLTFWYVLQNDPRLPADFRASAQKWGLPSDEFVESGHVTPQLYVREARRMLGCYVLRQQDLQEERHKPDGICQGSYTIDCHPVQEIETPEGRIPEGHLGTRVEPYEIPYRCITPVAPQNLVVVCAISATHVAYCSLRMEPVFMMLGQAGGLAVAQANEKNTSVQEIDVSALRGQLESAGIPLNAKTYPMPPEKPPTTPAGP